MFSLQIFNTVFHISSVISKQPVAPIHASLKFLLLVSSISHNIFWKPLTTLAYKHLGNSDQR